jgi:hypothetical protein
MSQITIGWHSLKFVPKVSHFHKWDCKSPTPHGIVWKILFLLHLSELVAYLLILFKLESFLWLCRRPYFHTCGWIVKCSPLKWPNHLSLFLLLTLFCINFTLMSFIFSYLSFCHLLYAFILPSHTIFFMFVFFYSLSIWISFPFKDVNKGETR